MNATIATANPTFHALTGTQPVGQTQIAAQADYMGAITTVKRCNDTYWSVATRDAVNAFRGPYNANGTTCAIWYDQTTAEYVVDYWGGTISSQPVEADRTRGLRAAIGVAASVTAQRWLDQRNAGNKVRSAAPTPSWRW